MAKLLETLIGGLSQGGVYALIALGYTMVYGIAKMLNFAHGDIIMVGGYTIMVFFYQTGMPIVALLAAIVVCVAVGLLTERLAYRPLRGASPLAVLITAIGVSSLLQSLTQLIFGTASSMVIVNTFGTIKIGSLVIEVSTLITLFSAAAVMIALTLFVNKTKTGKAMLAVSEDQGAAKLMGIGVNRVIAITFAVGSALAALAGYFSLLKSPSVSITMGSLPGIKAFTAAVFGGIGSIPGAMLGGILLGLIEQLSKTYISTLWADAIVFAVLVVVLVVKPTGLLGKHVREKV